MKINNTRVLLGGLLAGVILNIGEFLLNDVVAGAEMRAQFAKMGLTDPGPNFIVKAVLATFVLGIVIIYLYAVIRTHYGPGVKTAVCAALFAWFFVYLYSGVIYAGLGIISMKFFWIGVVWGAVEYVLAAIAGAWPYKDA